MYTRIFASACLNSATTMRTLRSSASALDSLPGSPATSKRKAEDSDEAPKSPKKPRVRKIASSNDIETPDIVPPPPPAPSSSLNEVSLVPATLSFSFEAAKAHLINADPRFEHLFSRSPCKPFEHLEQLHPMRSVHFMFQFACVSSYTWNIEHWSILSCTTHIGL